MWKPFIIIASTLLILEIVAIIYIATCPIEQAVHLYYVVPKPIILAGMYAIYFVLLDKTLLIGFGICLLAFYCSILYEEKETEKYIKILQNHHLR